MINKLIPENKWMNIWNTKWNKRELHTKNVYEPIQERTIAEITKEHGDTIKSCWTKNNEFIISDLENKIKDSESFLNESSVIASLQSTEDLNNFVGQITLKFLSSTWIQLRNNQDQIIFSKLMNKEDEFSYLILDNYSLTTGNAGNIIVLINGQTRGKVGKKGEVIDSLIIHSEFNN